MMTLLSTGSKLLTILFLLSSCMGDGSASAEYKVGECLAHQGKSIFKVESIDGPQVFVVELDRDGSRPVNMDMALGARNLERSHLAKQACP